MRVSRLLAYSFIALAALASFSCADDGDQGVGFAELTKYGSVKLNFTGTRIDNAAFSKDIEYKFTPIQSLYGSRVSKNGDNAVYFNVYRFFSAPGYGYQENSIQFSFTAEGGATPTISYPYFYIRTFIEGSDFKYFELNGNLSDLFASPVKEITDYTYDATTGRLKFKFAVTIPANEGGFYNPTGHEMTVKGEVDVIVYEELGVS